VTTPEDKTVTSAPLFAPCDFCGGVSFPVRRGMQVCAGCDQVLMFPSPRRQRPGAIAMPPATPPPRPHHRPFADLWLRTPGTTAPAPLWAVPPLL